MQRAGEAGTHKMTPGSPAALPSLTLNDSKKLLLPPPPFSILSSSPPRPIMDWLFRCSSSYRVSSRAARVRSCHDMPS